MQSKDTKKPLEVRHHGYQTMLILLLTLMESQEQMLKICCILPDFGFRFRDVFLGAPCAVPLDPRHRLLGTKYNPSRTFTPNGTVGIGGNYMCIYTMESPGGYQLVGRTVQFGIN